jgi:hypothetical protein
MRLAGLVITSAFATVVSSREVLNHHGFYAQDNPANSSANNTTNGSRFESDADKSLYINVIISLAATLVLLVLLLVQLVYRSKVRAELLARVPQRVRLAANVYLDRKDADPRSKIVEASIDVLKHKIEPHRAPQYDSRVYPSVIRENRDVRRDALHMIASARESAARIVEAGVQHAFINALLDGCTPQTATMTDILMALGHVLNPGDRDRFLAIYQKVLYSAHRGATEGAVTMEEVRRLYHYFENIIQPELTA